MPRNTGTGVILAGLSVALSVGMIWYIWWLAGASFAAILMVAIAHTFDYHRDFHIAADDVIMAENARTRLLATGH
jgi:cytochrome o ubiquinol oxidase subunit 1